MDTERDSPVGRSLPGPSAPTHDSGRVRDLHSEIPQGTGSATGGLESVNPTPARRNPRFPEPTSCPGRRHGDTGHTRVGHLLPQTPSPLGPLYGGGPSPAIGDPIEDLPRLVPSNWTGDVSRPWLTR